MNYELCSETFLNRLYSTGYSNWHAVYYQHRKRVKIVAKKLHNLCDVVVVVVDVERGPAIKCHLRVRRHRHQYMRSIYSFFSVFFFIFINKMHEF